MKFKDDVKKLKEKCDIYLNEVNAIGNECAYTDRLLEDVLDVSQSLKTKYQNAFK